jgi:hypothetical protein
MRKGVIGIMAIILLVLVGNLAWGRLRPDSATQASALALLQPDRQPGGRNAWATFWLLDYDVPANRLDAMYARERQYLFDRVGRLPADPSSPPPCEPLVAETYPKLPEIGTGGRARLCRGIDADCLGKMREQTSSLRALLAQLRGITPANALWDDHAARSRHSDSPVRRSGRSAAHRRCAGFRGRPTSTLITAP